MVFNSSSFLIFFLVVVLLIYLIPDKARNYWLLASSFYFMPAGVRNAYVLRLMHEYDPMKYEAYFDIKNEQVDLNNASRFLMYNAISYNSMVMSYTDMK